MTLVLVVQNILRFGSIFGVESVTLKIGLAVGLEVFGWGVLLLPTVARLRQKQGIQKAFEGY